MSRNPTGSVWDEWQEELFMEQSIFEQGALRLYEEKNYLSAI
jgi:hypothetical protein